MATESTSLVKGLAPASAELALDGFSDAGGGASLSPPEETAAGAAAAARSRSYEATNAARKCAYVFYFFGSVAWGVYAEIYTYFLQDVGGQSSARAAAIST